ncbi:glycosyltransferase family 2 protein [Granulicatella sp.]
MISVIVPVYNVEEYLEECLDSIQKQTYIDIEVILVNDGSTDKSKEICERYCRKDSRFKLVNQENKGLSGARNRGMLESKGEFISFVDSDDVLKEDMLEQLMKQMTSEDIDIVECWHTNDRYELELSTPKDAEIIFQGNGQEALVSLCKDNIVRLNTWAKLYRREEILKFPFLEGLFYEDVYGGIGILKHIRKMVKINYIGYYYRVRQGSIMNREFNKKNLDLFMICDKLEQLYQGDSYSLAYIYRRLFHLVLMHVVDYHIFEGNPYKEKYVEYLNRYAKASSRSLVMRAYHFFPQNIVFISRVAGAIQWRVEKYFIRGLWKGMK